MINAAIVGLGRWGQILVDSVQADSEVIRFKRAVTRTPSKVEDYCKKQGLSLGDDYAAALADPEIDAVVLASPHTLHKEQILAAAAAGKHVFCEKPFALTKADAEAALNALANAGLKAGVGHNRRFSPNLADLKRMADAGDLGDLIHIEGQMSANMAGAGGTWRDSRAESPAGGMTSLGIHVLDSFIGLFGPVAEVATFSKRVAIPYDIDDSTSVFLEFANGRTGYLGTIAGSGSLFAVRVFGTNGWAEARAHDHLEYALNDGSSDSRHYDGYAYPGILTVRGELEAFAKNIEGAEPAVPPEQILQGIAALEAIFKSAEQNGARVAV